MEVFDFLPKYLQLAFIMLPFAGFAAYLHFRCRDWVEKKIGDDTPQAIFWCALGGNAPSCAGVVVAVSLFKRGVVRIKSLTTAAIAALGDSGLVLWASVYTAWTATMLFTALKLHAILFILGILSAYLILPFGRVVDRPVCYLAALITWWADKFNRFGNRLRNKPGLIVNQRQESACDLEPETARQAVWYEVRSTLKILFWIFIVFFVVSLLQTKFGLDIKALSYTKGLKGVLLGAALGIIPSCGVQVSVIALWATGDISTAMFMANIIAQDGDGFWILWFSNPIIALKIKILMVLEGIAAGFAYLYVF